MNPTWCGTGGEHELVVTQARPVAQCPQTFAAIGGESGKGARILLEAARPAFGEEAQAPHPLREIRARAKEKRRVFAPEPAQDLWHDRRLRPRLSVGGGDLAAVGERCLHAGTVVPVDDADVVAGLREIPRGSGTDDAGTEDENFHYIMIAACLFSPSASAASS